MKRLFRLLGFKEVDRSAKIQTQSYTFGENLTEQHKIVRLLCDGQDPRIYVGSATVDTQKNRLLYRYGVDVCNRYNNDPVQLHLALLLIEGMLHGVVLPDEVIDTFNPLRFAEIEAITAREQTKTHSEKPPNQEHAGTGEAARHPLVGFPVINHDA